MTAVIPVSVAGRLRCAAEAGTPVVDGKVAR
jgi:hypothetical protein